MLIDNYNIINVFKQNFRIILNYSVVSDPFYFNNMFVKNSFCYLVMPNDSFFPCAVVPAGTFEPAGKVMMLKRYRTMNYK